MPRPLAAGRHRDILRRLEQQETASVEELALAFSVSRETIRRDLKVLASDNRLAVVHGGAVRSEGREASFARRWAENRDGKAAIGRLAAALVRDGMSVLLDSGTTTLAVAFEIARSGRERLSIATTSLVAAQGLRRLPGVRIHLTGGEYDPNDDSTGGPAALKAISRLRVDLAFVGVGGLGAAGEATDFTRAGAAMRGAMLHAATQAFLVADHGKFGHACAVRIDERDRPAGLIVDEPLSPAVASHATRRPTVIQPG